MTIEYHLYWSEYPKAKLTGDWLRHSLRSMSGCLLLMIILFGLGSLIYSRTLVGALAFTFPDASGS